MVVVGVGSYMNIYTIHIYIKLESIINYHVAMLIFSANKIDVFKKKKNAKCTQLMNKYLLCRKHNIMKYNRKINVNLNL